MTAAAWVLLAAATWLGAAVGPALALPVLTIAAASAALLSRTRAAAVATAVALLLLSAVLAHRAREPLVVEDGQLVSGVATVVVDPEWSGPSLRVVVELDGRRLVVFARGPAATALAPSEVGHRIEVEGVTRALSESLEWMRAQHVAGRLDVDAARPVDDGELLWRAANGVRGAIARGGDVLDRDQRALYLGMVYGDDRGQSPVVESDVRRTGLGHLVAVSGQNVAYVLLLLSPLLRRLDHRLRAIVAISGLVFFGFITRFEPSVLRAVTMAGGATVATLLGRFAEGLQLLAMSVVALILVDPLLVQRVGFRLSVAAAAGILVAAEPLARRMSWAGPARNALAVTLAAQCAVAPLVAAEFGGVSTVSIPANVLAAPVAGPVMLWGAVVGPVAGLAGDGVASFVLAPVRPLLWWVLAVARMGASLPFDPLGPWSVAGVAASIIAATRKPLLGVGLVSLVALSAWGGPPVGSDEPVPGALLHVDGAVVLVLDSPNSPVALLDALRQANVDAIDLVVARRGGARDSAALEVVIRRIDVTRILAPADHRILGARDVTTDRTESVGSLRVHITVSPDGHLDVDVAQDF